METSTGILVVGAGIGGLTAALAFAKAGFTVDVYERAPLLEEAGAGLQLSPNALRVLSGLDVDPADFRGVAADSVTLRSGSTGKALASVPVAASDGTAYLSLHRADLQAALLAAVRRQPRITLTLGAACTRIGPTESAWRLTFSGGQDGPFEREAAIVVAADGVGSVMARNLGHPAAQPSGDIAWRMTVRHPPGGGSGTLGIEAWLGPGRHAVAYPVRNGDETNLVLIGRGKDIAADADASKQGLISRFAGWDPRLLALIASAGAATAWPLSTRSPLDSRKSPPGLFLIGDAAHAMLPYAAQGAAMAIEDAWVAAQCVAQAATAAAAREMFAAQRDARVARVIGRVAFHRRVYHLPFPLSVARNVALRARPKAALARDLAWLYDWVPPSV